MAEQATSSYNWLRAIQPEIAELQDLSQTGGPEDFSWEQLGQAIAQRFELETLRIEPTRTEWKSEKKAAKGLGKNLVCLRYSFSSLPGEAVLLVPGNDFKILMNALLTRSAQAPLDLDPSFQAGFERFLSVELANFLTQIGFDGELLLEAIDHELPPEQAGLCQDLAIQLQGASLSARIYASEELTIAWKERFAGKAKTKKKLSKQLLRQVDVIVHFEAGKVELKRSVLRKTRPGDFIILDSCSVLPGEEKGRVTLTVEGIPVFRGMLKDDKIKVLEYPLYHKVETAMENDEDFEVDDSIEEERDEFEDETEELEEEDADSLSEGTPVTERAGDIPVTLTIELGRIKMKLDKLTELQPGQLLELEVSPEEAVDLVINGRCIGRGELLKLGETLGVRVLDLA
ncbi:MAG: YscQ/HrcQ family type III secretion apparatus protein [Oceanospirillaceae bacterium]|nr:YscQ/HrcQ family type III secretion apparatus protein [Oceanospirillaceae bacterium]